MAYRSHEANVVKSALESVMVNPEGSVNQAREGLAALERLVLLYLPEGEDMRRLQEAAAAKQEPR